MKRRDLEHIIRAAADIADDDEIIIIGSQAILGPFPSAPSELCVSMEADVYPKNHCDRWDLIDGSIGEGSPFHATYGYYAQGVGPDTATLPAGWQSRLIAVRNENTRQCTGWCIEQHDLVLSKYVAGREKDFYFNRVAVSHGLVTTAELLARVDVLPLDEKMKKIVRERIRYDAQPLR